VPDHETPPSSEESTSTGTWRSHRFHRLDTRIAGEDLGRIVSLTDGVFAFALTLLVLSLTVPISKTGHFNNGQLGAALNQDYGTFLAYGFAFVMIALWWVVHNRTYQYIAKFDSNLVWLNMAMLAQIAVMPFVLDVYAQYGFGSSVQPALQYAVVMFAAVQISLGLTMTGIWEYARHAHLTKPDVSVGVSNYITRRGLLTSLVFAISIGVTFYSITLAELTWVGIFFVQRFLTVVGD
jgi:uncharacterized membrane protein